ncbi:MAG: amino acid permease [Gammaproteobacteria bacterium]|nr:amino acid permease [Gammaproteobacteria bacterium]
MSTIAKLNTFALTLLITGAIDSIRNLPASALFGSSLIFFFIFAAIVFLIPTALISAELTANVDEGGIYQWGRLAFGERIGFLAVWLQWVNNVVWFPTILSFIAGTAAYLVDPALAQNKYYLVAVILSTFWLLTLINLKGIRMSSKFTSFCAITGLIIPVGLIIILLLVWLYMGKPIQIQFTAQSILPNFQNTDNWISLTAIMLGFAGMELATVHIKDVKNPRQTFPRALAISTFIILITMMLGSLAIAMVLPNNQINLVNGTIQTFSYFLSVYGLSWITPILTVLLVIGSLGGIVSWVISPVKGMAQAAHNGFLPAVFKKENAHGVPQNLLLLQACLVSIVCMAFLFLPSVNGSYWLLTALSTQLYICMYVLMFVTALRLKVKKKYQLQHGTFAVPGKNIGFWSVCLLGLFGCLITLIVGFLPPTTLNIGSKLYYEILFCSGMLIMIMPVVFFFWYERRYNGPRGKLITTTLVLDQEQP